MSTLAEKLADAWIKRDLIQLKSDELPKNREDSHAIQKQFHAVLKKKQLVGKLDWYQRIYKKVQKSKVL